MSVQVLKVAGAAPGEVDLSCMFCAVSIFEEKTSDKIDQIAKEKGLWGLAIKTKVNQLGSSIAITVNKKLANFIGLKRGEEVFIHPENKKRIIIEVR